MCIFVRLDERDEAPGTEVLVRVAPGTAPARDPAHGKTVYTGLRVLPGSPGVEDWLSTAPVARGYDQGLYYAHNGRACFGWSYFKASDSLMAATQAAYTSAFRVFRKLGFAHLLRAWHYLPGIHAPEGSASRYACFCRGRVAAFEAACVRDYCAATVIGTRADFGVMYFLAASEAGAAIENPRQTSAWRYPLPVAEERPLFARAVCKAWGDRTHFYGSGMASIVGHESRHPGDAAAQLREILLNLRVLLDAAPEFFGAGHLTSLKAYARSADDESALHEVLAASPFTFDSTAWFEGEICRPELHVEIEVLAG